MLTFIEEPHSYKLRGIHIPGMSECLQASNIPDFSRVPHATMEYAQQRGKAVHKGTELLDKGQLDWSTVDPVITGYVLAWEKFCAEYGVCHIEIEQRVYSEILWCAGTPDRVSIVEKYNGDLTLIDIKSGEYESSGALQTAGYEIMRNERNKATKIQRRMIVKVNKDGTYGVAPEDYFKRSDYEDVKAIIRTYHVKKRLGVL